jgi:hypothetical protein
VANFQNLQKNQLKSKNQRAQRPVQIQGQKVQKGAGVDVVMLF